MDVETSFVRAPSECLDRLLPPTAILTAVPKRQWHCAGVVSVVWKACWLEPISQEALPNQQISLPTDHAALNFHAILLQLCHENKLWHVKPYSLPHNPLEGPVWLHRSIGSRGWDTRGNSNYAGRRSMRCDGALSSEQSYLTCLHTAGRRYFEIHRFLDTSLIASRSEQPIADWLIYAIFQNLHSIYELHGIPEFYFTSVRKRGYSDETKPLAGSSY
ncbi:hypothetical protein DFH27DRAFT_394072 [Peziza echinospora]|nr:hypothetical protein DFH27DRAFT_394072 [Peziza echinospora]